MTLAELITFRVRGHSGWTYGRIHDIRIEWRGDEAVVTTLIVGRHGLRERLFGRGKSSEHRHRVGHGSEIRWDQVTTIEPPIVTVKEERA
jgi:sporulation protein YlmC with PRC-barrel domain